MAGLVFGFRGLATRAVHRAEVRRDEPEAQPGLATTGLGTDGVSLHDNTTSPSSPVASQQCFARNCAMAIGCWP
jgi:hypothetical protein